MKERKKERKEGICELRDVQYEARMVKMYSARTTAARSASDFLPSDASAYSLALWIVLFTATTRTYLLILYCAV